MKFLVEGKNHNKRILPSPAFLTFAAHRSRWKSASPQGGGKDAC